MKPPSSSARTRRRQGGAEIPARRASSTLVIRPSACRSRRMRRSILSSFVWRIPLILPARPFVRSPTPNAQLYYRASLGVQSGVTDGQGRAPVVWAVHDGRIGIRNQVVGLAEAIGGAVVEKRLPGPPPGGGGGRREAARDPRAVALARSAALAGAAQRRRAGGRLPGAALARCHGHRRAA